METSRLDDSDAQRAAHPYPDGGWAVVDVETTGLGRTDRIVSVGVYRLDPRGEVLDHWYTPVNPERDPGPVWIHGLTSEHLEGAPTFPEIADRLAEQLSGRVLVAHNALFDWSMISREYARMGGRAPVEQRLCTIVLARDLRLPLANHRLGTLAGHFGVIPRQAHHALDDARVLAEVFRPSLRLAVEAGLPLPFQPCVAPALVDHLADDGTDTSGGGMRGGSARGAGWSPYRPARRRPACPYPNPGRWAPEQPLVQGMRVAISGDTATDRELLEDRLTEAGLHVAGSVSSRTSLLVTNEPGGWTTKARRAREVGTPVVDEAAFLHLLQAVVPQQRQG
ncbi:DEDDh family exonuclease [Streptacidiphilus carbonis]|jgi:DNA polymerase III subunit epsilon|uniref:DEDDh family exonuclease n=1 Tax=Streptacidiphilus carbonis TaxID=105422 RepID=UPI0005A65584|nr:DEDDh family exonuclease [Streptacidiphilus carbonis]